MKPLILAAALALSFSAAAAQDSVPTTDPYEIAPDTPVPTSAGATVILPVAALLILALFVG